MEWRMSLLVEHRWEDKEEYWELMNYTTHTQLEQEFVLNWINQVPHWHYITKEALEYFKTFDEL